MIQLTRVDHRLLHGQVVFKWSRTLQVNCILIADDSVSNDPLRMSALRMAKPDSCKLVIKSIDDSIRAIRSGVTDSYSLLIITGSIADAYRLVSGVPAIQKINLGGTRSEAGRHPISKAMFVSDEDEKLLREMHEKGVQIEIQMVPDDVPEDAMHRIGS